MSVIENVRQWNKLRLSRRRNPKMYVAPGRFAYIPVRKCATRSMKDLLAMELLGCQREENASGSGIPEEAIEELDARYARFVDHQRMLHIASELYTFAIVRHPLQRLLSAYKNRVLMAQDSRIRIKHGISSDMDFPEFVAAVCDIPDDIIDRHLRSQCWHLCYQGQLIPRHLVRMEDFSTHWGDVEQNTGLPCPPALNKSQSLELPELEANQNRLINERYYNDFAILGYDFL